MNWELGFYDPGFQASDAQRTTTLLGYCGKRLSGERAALDYAEAFLSPHRDAVGKVRGALLSNHYPTSTELADLVAAAPAAHPVAVDAPLRIAMHEAGHAIVGAAASWPILEVSIVGGSAETIEPMEGGPSGHVIQGSGGWTRHGTIGGAINALDLLSYYWAGAAAEQLAFGAFGPDGATLDAARGHSEFTRRGWPLDVPQAYRRAQEVLVANQDAARLLAATLVTERQLSGEALDGVLADVRPVP